MSDKQQTENPAALRLKADAAIKHDPDAAAASDSEDVDKLGARIERTRAEMAETVSAIQDKLDPRTLKRQARDAARAATVGRVESVVETADENVHRLVQTLGERTTTIKESAAQQAQRLADKVQAIREPTPAGDELDPAPYVPTDEQEASEPWKARATQASLAARRALQEVKTQIRRHPLAGCLVALALGTALGRAIRSSANGHDRPRDVQIIPPASPAITVAEAYPEV
ncbi:MAG: DUF3618 domain-containing protein [Chloroflexota bacterium]